MKSKILFILVLVLFFSCTNEKSLEFLIVSNNEIIKEISIQDILFYDTTKARGSIQIHEIRLKDNYYTEDSLVLIAPVEIRCKLDDTIYFISEYFHKWQSEPSLGISFHFDPTCENKWTFNEKYDRKPYRWDTIILYPSKECNSIELFHKEEIMKIKADMFKNNPKYINHMDTAHLAHEVLLDPKYLNIIKESGIPIR